MAHYDPLEFVILSIIFAAVMAFMVWYNLRMKARAKKLAHRDDSAPSAIVAAHAAGRHGH